MRILLVTTIFHPFSSTRRRLEAASGVPWTLGDLVTLWVAMVFGACWSITALLHG